MVKIVFCKGCGAKLGDCKNGLGEVVCVMCAGIEPESGVPVTMELPETIHCSDCDSTMTLNQDTGRYCEHWKDGIPPFFNAKRGTYYCGCRGWD